MSHHAAVVRSVLQAVAASLAVSALASAQTPSSAADTISLYGVVSGETSVDGMSSAEVATPATTSSETRGGEFVIAPIPIVNPTIKDGLALVGGFMYHLDREDQITPPSITGAGGFKTNNGSWAVAGLQSFHLAHDLIRIRAVAAYADINYAFFGTGEAAGNAGVSVDLNQAGAAGVAEGLLRIAPNLYAGARYQLMEMTVKSGKAGGPDAPVPPAEDAQLRSAALGPRIEYDSRDNVFYPRHGQQIQGIASFYDESVGGRRTYQLYQASLNQYYGIGKRQVYAWHIAACDTEGAVPFYDLCLLGKPQDLRGYSVGRYRDGAMVAAQVEWRTELWWRLGAAAFVGGGIVAPALSALALHDVLPGGGAGLRVTLADQNHVNLRIDYAWGKGSSALYVGVAEAF